MAILSKTAATPSADRGRLPAMPELLAPAGDWNCARAAVENGADAIYFGLDKFNARMRAANFTEADLPPLMEFLHRRGVRGYVTLNTLVFEDELADARQYLRTVIASGADAAIVQDVGICRMIRELSPDFPIHASTQMTITSATGVEFARQLGCNLVVLSRELSVSEIERINAGAGVPRSSFGAGSGLPLEVFVHGALCVAYSGQCLTSESLGGRSANRGECAQACRMPYELLADGRAVPLGDRRYLLSPQDLSGIDLLPELVRAGVASLKIEGRLKTPEYVANITRVYRAALDHLAADLENQQNPGSHPTRCATGHSPFPIPRYDLEMAFSRGLHTGWLGGIDNRKLVHARFGKKRGVFLGPVVAVDRDSVSVELAAPLKPGDGVVFDAGRPDEKEEGGRVYGVRNADCGTRIAEDAPNKPQRVLLTFGNNAIDFSRVRVGDRLWKTSDPVLEKRWRQSYEGSTPRFQQPIAYEVHGLAGKPLTLLARNAQGHLARVDSSVPLVPAERQPLTTERLRQQLGRLGGTPFRLGELVNRIEGDVILPVSELNRLRREVIGELERQRVQPKRWTLHAERPTVRPTTTGDRLETAPTLIVLVRNPSQLEVALRCGVETVYCDFENPRAYRDAVQLSRDSALRTPHLALFVAPPRIFKPGEEWQLEQVRSCDADGYLLRNYDHLRFFEGSRCVGDFSLNIANRISADYFVNAFGLERVTASYDLNVTQLEALLRAGRPDRFEITLHQHMPMFHMEHCVFCAFLSEGRDYRDCGRPCDRHDVSLRDRVGVEHPLKADVGCRNTVFNARAQTGAEYADRMIALGVRCFRIEFLNEPADVVERTIGRYRQLLRGEITGAALWKELKLFNQLGVTRGPMAGAG